MAPQSIYGGCIGSVTFPDEMFAYLSTDVGRRGVPPMSVAVGVCQPWPPSTGVTALYRRQSGPSGSVWPAAVGCDARGDGLRLFGSPGRRWERINPSEFPHLRTEAQGDDTNLSLDSGSDEPGVASPGGGAGAAFESPIGKLSELIATLNEKFGMNLTDDDKVWFEEQKQAITVARLTSLISDRTLPTLTTERQNCGLDVEVVPNFGFDPVATQPPLFADSHNRVSFPA
jgi:hypothetical protein